jgi:hypothetical protein
VLQPPQAIDQRVVGHLDRVIEREPSHLLALPWWRRGIVVGGLEQISKIQMEVLPGRMRVQMQEHGTAVGVAYSQPGFLCRLSEGGFRRSLAWVDVATRLQPATDALVPVQHRAAPPGHDGRPGHMDGVVIATERVGQPVKLGQEPGARGNLALGRRVESSYRFAQLSHTFLAPRTPVAVHVSHHAQYCRVRDGAIGKDWWVRHTTITAVAVLIAALATACTARTAAPQGAIRVVSITRIASGTPPDGSDTCYAFAVSALRRHVVVRRLPAACAGLPQVQVNEDVARAIRTVVGPHPKAIARRLALAYSRYLANLVRPVRPPPAVSVAAAGPASSGNLALRFTALAAWLAAALAGSYLLAGWLTRDWRRRVFRKPVAWPVVPLSHAGLAVTGLLIWIAFTVTNVAALAWTDVGLTWVIAGLGMATLLTGSDEQGDVRPEAAAPGVPAGSSTAPFPVKAPVVVIALHGALATLTILLVLLAAVGVG